MLDPDTCYTALVSRDRRFDGRFFTGITSTGIYCRPVCPARTPSRDNVRFYPSAAAAEAAGFRACLRCRPETAPSGAAWQGTAATVRRGVRLIHQGALDHGDLPTLAARLGVGERHLRRLFHEHLGATPTQVAHSLRNHSTRALLMQSELPMSEVAQLAGFASIRRFNHVVKVSFGRTPTELRATGAAPSGRLTLHLAYRPPFAWSKLLAFLGPRAPARVESASDGVWRRMVGTPDASGVLEVRHQPDRGRLEVRLPAALAADLHGTVRRLRDLFDLDADPEAIAAVLTKSPLLRPTLLATPGLRMPGAWSGFELAVRAILGQQISVAAANTLFARVVERWGPEVPEQHGLDRLFPTPVDLVSAEFETVGVTRARSAALRGLAAHAAEGRLDLGPRASLEAYEKALCRLKGIGPWTARYLAMRVAKEPDAFPASDLGLLRAGRAKPVSAKELQAESTEWRPWRAYAAITLWNTP